MTSFVFVGEKRSPRAIRMDVTWDDGRLAAKTLREALVACRIDPNLHRFVNLFHDGEGLVVNDDVVPSLRTAIAQGCEVVAMGRLVQRQLANAGIPFRRLVHPAARGAIRATARYREHVAEVMRS